MSSRIAILGASGAVGSSLAAHILRSHLLEPSDSLLLVGHGVLASERKLLGTRIDLLDAFDDERVNIEIVPDVCDVEADIIVIAAGVSLSPQCSNRRDMGAANRVVFERIAEQCASRLPQALYVVVTNPVELGVHILSGAADRKRVIGMGAQQDALRFARAIAADLGMSRHDVRASVLGEHGNAMVPLWRSVELLVRDPIHADALKDLVERGLGRPLEERVEALRSQVANLVLEERIAEAYDVTRSALPDARIFVEPFITRHSMHSTPNATSNATLQCLAAALANDRRRIHGQVFSTGEVLGNHGVCGIPLTLRSDGWHADALDWLDLDERSALMGSMECIEQCIAEIMAAPPPSHIPAMMSQPV
jgi:malate dehydrogenase